MNNVKKLSSLLIFAEVVNQQSFTRAGKQLGLSKAAVSQHIKKLEDDVGLQLLSRHTRGMSLTAAGEKLFNRCDLLRDQVDLAYEELSVDKEVPSGVFALSIPASFEKEIVIPALKQLCIEYPLIKPHLHVSDQGHDLIEHNLDVTIFGGKLKDSNYRALPIGTVGEIFCASPQYIEKHGNLEKLNELGKHKFIAAAWQSSPLAVYHNNALNDKLLIDVDYAINTNFLPSALEFLLNDMGVALIPEFVIQSALAQGKLKRVLHTYQGRQWTFNLLHRFQGEKPIHITRFYQLVKYFFAKV